MCSPIDLRDPNEPGNTNSFYTTHNFGNYLGKDQSCVGKASYVSIPGVGTFCGGHFSKINSAPSNMIMVKTISDDINRYTMDNYYPVDILDGLDVSIMCPLIMDSVYTIFNDCTEADSDFPKKCICTEFKESQPTDYVREGLGFCLTYTPT